MRKGILFLLAIIACFSCSTPAIVFSSEKVKEVDFSKYKTYAFLPTTDTNYAKLVNRKVLIPLMVDEVKTQLAGKGMTLDTLHPDCLFTYQMLMKRDYTASQEKITEYSPQTMTRADLPMYDYTTGGISGGTYVRSSTKPGSDIYYYSSDNRPYTYNGKMQIDTLREGSLVIDMIDAQSREVVWRSIVKGKKMESAAMSPKDATEYYIPKMLKKLPRK